MSFNRLQSAYTSLDGRANNALSFLNDPKVSALLHLAFIGYAGKVAQAVPVQYTWIFVHPLFQILVLSLVLWTSSDNWAFSLATVSAYLLFLHYLNKRYEGFTGFKTAIYPGCTNTTVADLRDAFQGNDADLAQAMQASLVPFNVVVSDDNAPLIATYLMNHGYKLRSPCAPPGS